MTARDVLGPATSQLRRLARTPVPEPDRGRRAQHTCELCSEPLPDEHRHLLDLTSRQLCCACRACSLLFDREATGTGRYRAVPRLRKRLPADPLDDVTWAALEVPVRLAFFVPHSGDAGDGSDTGDVSVTAYYPSPLGVVGTAVDEEAWARVNPDVAERLEPDVTALLVRRDAGEHWLVGIDECYRLTARVRHTWTGMTGGDEVWHEIDRFFAELRGAPAPT
ncbi:hypothetical protein B1813_18595 [Saccharomonospora piscinae]|uniref:Uncharacterized protein n=1 Tax=Saccharomonospora piscinae TaxID=687388 RepID=A0A1V8ZY42_SACPI|nr:DUF5947 family protein [Saccharomonospora piscinae]OQO89857.1 hypothetical protein B1813_18595 [Saccharomonospora piscinae]